MIFCKCDNSSDIHIGNHKNLILFVRWRNQVRYFLPCYISHFTDLLTQADNFTFLTNLIKFYGKIVWFCWYLLAFAFKIISFGITTCFCI